MKITGELLERKRSGGFPIDIEVNLFKPKSEIRARFYVKPVRIGGIFEVHQTLFENIARFFWAAYFLIEYD